MLALPKADVFIFLHPGCCLADVSAGMPARCCSFYRLYSRASKIVGFQCIEGATEPLIIVPMVPQDVVSLDGYC